MVDDATARGCQLQIDLGKMTPKLHDAFYEAAHIPGVNTTTVMADAIRAAVAAAVDAEREHWGDYLLELAGEYFEHAELARGLRAAGWRIKKG